MDVSITAGTFNVVPEMIRLMAQHPEYDLIIVNVGEDFILDRPEAGRRLGESVQGYLDQGRHLSKPLAVVLGYGDAADEWRWRAIVEARDAIWGAGFAVYPTVGRAARALRRFVDWGTATAPRLPSPSSRSPWGSAQPLYSQPDRRSEQHPPRTGVKRAQPRHRCPRPAQDLRAGGGATRDRPGGR